VELGIVIGQPATQVEDKDALGYVAGYCVTDDVSARDVQLSASGGGQWDEGKGGGTFGLVGPWLVSKDEIPDVRKLSIGLKVKGELRQQSNTKEMIFNVSDIVSYVLQFMMLYPRDVIATGAPAGVGIGRKAPMFEPIGDVVTLGIDGPGEQKQTLVQFEKKRLKNGWTNMEQVSYGVSASQSVIWFVLDKQYDAIQFISQLKTTATWSCFVCLRAHCRAVNVLAISCRVNVV